MIGPHTHYESSPKEARQASNLKEGNVIELGSRVVDIISGFEGIATARSEYLFGCKRVQITRTELDANGKLLDEWFDETGVTVLDGGIVKKLKEKRTKAAVSPPPGGPNRSNGSRVNPTR